MRKANDRCAVNHLIRKGLRALAKRHITRKSLPRGGSTRIRAEVLVMASASKTLLEPSPELPVLRHNV